jgi:hypothetical protein
LEAQQDENTKLKKKFPKKLELLSPLKVKFIKLFLFFECGNSDYSPKTTKTTGTPLFDAPSVAVWFWALLLCAEFNCGRNNEKEHK